MGFHPEASTQQSQPPNCPVGTGNLGPAAWPSSGRCCRSPVTASDAEETSEHPQNSRTSAGSECTHQGKPTLGTFSLSKAGPGTFPLHRLLKAERAEEPSQEPHKAFTPCINCICYLGCTQVSSQLQHGFNSPSSFLVNCWELSLTRMELQLHKFTAEQAPNVTSIQTYLQVYPFGK